MSKRVSIVLTDDEYEVLQAYASASHKRPTTVVSDIVKDLLPTFTLVSAAVNKAEGDKAKVLADLNLALLKGIYQASELAVVIDKGSSECP